MESKIDSYFCCAILIFSFLSLIIFTPIANTATYQEKTTSSSATVNVWVEISLSANLSSGILFGSVNPNTNDNNASGNFNGSSETQYNVTAGSANNVNIDLCIKDSAALTKGGSTIPNTGYTYNFSATNDASNPLLPGTAITTTYATTQHTNISANTASQARFWIDVPASQGAGAYSNTVYIEGIETGGACV